MEQVAFLGTSPAPATQSPGASRESSAGDRQVAGRVRVQDSVRSVEFFCHSRARVWRARGIPNSAGGRGEGPGFFARQPRENDRDRAKTGAVTMICRVSI